MRASLLTAVAAVALITGGGVAAAQSMDNSRGGATGAPQSTLQRPPGMAQNPSERGTMQTPNQGRSGAVEERGRPEHDMMQGPTQGRSGAVEEQERRSGERDMMQSPTQGRSVGSEPLSRDQRSRLHESIIGGNLHRADRVDFALSVGTRIPDTVAFPDTTVIKLLNLLSRQCLNRSVRCLTQFAISVRF